MFQESVDAFQHGGCVEEYRWIDDDVAAASSRPYKDNLLDMMVSTLPCGYLRPVSAGLPRQDMFTMSQDILRHRNV